MDQKLVQEYLEVLVCPKCRKELKWESLDDQQGFLCERCQLLYPVVDEIPIMLVEEAIKLKITENESS